MLKGATALGALVAASGELSAQQAAANRKEPGCAAAAARRIRHPRRHVLTMDPKIADLAAGDVHVRDGAIVAVGAKMDAPRRRSSKAAA